MDNGIFLTFEGADGSGKTTQINLLKNLFEEKKLKYIISREPGGSPISEKIRELIIDKNNNMSEITEAYLYAASRSEHVETKIKPALEKGFFVICDRFLDSSLAYQGFAREIGFEKILKINEFAINNILPNLTIFMDIEPQIALKRRTESAELDRIELEKIEFHEKVYMGYKKISSIYKERYFSVDASDNINNIHNKIVQIINKKFKGVLQ